MKQIISSLVEDYTNQRIQLQKSIESLSASDMNYCVKITDLSNQIITIDMKIDSFLDRLERTELNTNQ